MNQDNNEHRLHTTAIVHLHVSSSHPPRHRPASYRWQRGRTSPSSPEPAVVEAVKGASHEIENG